MNNARDVFTLSLFGRKPTVVDLLEALPREVANELLGQDVSPSSRLADAVPAAAEGKNRIFEAADLILNCARLDREDLEAMAVKNDVGLKRGESAHAIAARFIQKVGVKVAKNQLEEALKPGALDTIGTFAHYLGPRLAFRGADLLGWGRTLEQRLEEHLSREHDRRLVKVRAERLKDRILFGVYFQRPNVEGRAITQGKRLATKSFAQSAGSTYFVVKQVAKTQTLVMLKSPGAPLARALHGLIGETLWGTPGSLSRQPTEAYNLNVFKNPALTLTINADYLSEVDQVRMDEIGVRAATGNLLTLKASRGADAYHDFQQVSRGARIFVANSQVRSVALKFRSAQDHRKLIASVVVQPCAITLDEQHWGLVDAHLRDWGVMRD